MFTAKECGALARLTFRIARKEENPETAEKISAIARKYYDRSYCKKLAGSNLLHYGHEGSGAEFYPRKKKTRRSGNSDGQKEKQKLVKNDT